MIAPRRAGRRRLGTWVVAAMALVATLASSPAFACSVCYGNEATVSPLLTGARLGVFLLLGITAAVLAGFARFFFYLRHRALAAEREGLASDWTQLQRSSLP